MGEVDITQRAAELLAALGQGSPAQRAARRRALAALSPELAREKARLDDKLRKGDRVLGRMEPTDPAYGAREDRWLEWLRAYVAASDALRAVEGLAGPGAGLPGLLGDPGANQGVA